MRQDIVMPGGIDPHVHLHHVWIKPDGTPLVTAGPEQVGRAALFGGTTTFIDFAYWRDGVSALQAIGKQEKVRETLKSGRAAMLDAISAVTKGRR